MAAVAPPLEEISARATALADHYELTMETIEKELKEVSLEEFICNNMVNKIYSLAHFYEELYKSAGVTSRKDLDALVQSHGSRETFAGLERLLDVESEWGTFALALDGRLKSDGRQPPARLTAVPGQLELQETTTGRRCRLDDWSGTRLLVLHRFFA